MTDVIIIRHPAEVLRTRALLTPPPIRKWIPVVIQGGKKEGNHGHQP